MVEGGKTMEGQEILNIYVLVSLSYGRGWEDFGGSGDTQCLCFSYPQEILKVYVLVSLRRYSMFMF